MIGGGPEKRTERGAVRGHQDRGPGSCRADDGRGIGGAERDRTVDLLIANEALSQLSYQEAQ